MEEQKESYTSLQDVLKSRNEILNNKELSDYLTHESVEYALVNGLLMRSPKNYNSFIDIFYMFTNLTHLNILKNTNFFVEIHKSYFYPKKKKSKLNR